MPIQFNCPCGKTLRVPDEFAGRRAKCPSCGVFVNIPGPDPVFEIEEKPPPGTANLPGKSGKSTNNDDDERGTYGLARD